MTAHLRQLVEDEKQKLSAARVGLWITVVLALATVGVDVALTLGRAKALIPNTVYGLEGTMFTVFASWAAGPRIAQYLGPQVGQVAAGLASAVRDARLPSKHDDERGDPQ
ncbi:MAG: hypothetical protein JWM41_2923 [Gemmatimonadetes bacterium]|nr:hypothetical protein [Gemmatimonadota bacterium]